MRSEARLLQFMSLTGDRNAGFERRFFQSFSARNRVQAQYVEDPGGTVNNRLDLYTRFFREHSSRPDMVAVDVVWPSILADDLLDLRPYVKDQLKAFSPGLLETFTVKGRLVALPTFTDVGILFYRADLLAHYGFSHPPTTWEELEHMAAVIQAGERRRGNPDFWGYTWQGGPYEGLTCNALEWQASAGAGDIVSADGKIHVRDPAFLKSLSRAVRWIGTISPPGEYIYRETDSANLWNAGQVAFMRNWASGYVNLSSVKTEGGYRFGVAPLPGGVGGQRGTLGGQGIGISKYAANRPMAIKALLEITSPATDFARVFEAGSLPVQIANQTRPEVKQNSLVNAASEKFMRGITVRPAVISGARYEDVSRAYYTAVNSVLRRAQDPEGAMEGLEKKLKGIFGKSK